MQDENETIYPLYCVDRGKHGTDGAQYYGPFTSHDEADAELPPKYAEPDAHIRRCRRVKPSEIGFNFDEVAEDLAAGDLRDPFDWLVDELDEAARNNELPNHAWFCFDERVVAAGPDVYDPDDFPLPDAATFKAWIDKWLIVDAYICEGDE